MLAVQSLRPQHRAAEALPGLAAAILFEENAEQQQVLALTSLLLLLANGPDRQRYAASSCGLSV